MANKNKNLIIAYFPSREKADQAAEDLKVWEDKQSEIKLGGMGVMTADEKGKLKTHRVGARAGGTGAKWGFVLGAVTGVLSGGLSLLGGAIAGLAAGTVAGSLFHKRIGMSDQEKDQLLQHLNDGGAALAVMADDHEVNPLKFELTSLDGQVQSYIMSDDTMQELEGAAAEEGIEDLDEVTIMDGSTSTNEVPDAPESSAAAAAAGFIDDDVQRGSFDQEQIDLEGKVIEPTPTAADQAAADDDQGKKVDTDPDAGTGEEQDSAMQEEAPEPVVPEDAAQRDDIAQEDEELGTEHRDQEQDDPETGTDEGQDSTMHEEASEPVVPEDAARRDDITAEQQEEQEQSRSAVLHFKRYQEDYDGWGIHVWYGCREATSWGRPLPPKDRDDFGLIFEVPLDPDAPGLAYIIHRGDEKDHWEDQYLDFEQHGHEVWLVQHMPGYIDRS